MFPDIRRFLSSLSHYRDTLPPNSSIHPELSIPKIVRSSSHNDIVQSVPSGARWLENFERNPQLQKVFTDALQGRVLVDLGSSERWSSMYQLACVCGAARYVGVDRFLKSKKVEASILDSNCELELIRADMLTHVASLESQSVCISVNAIDRAVISSPIYHQRLGIEIQRVVVPGGLAFGILSEALTRLVSSESSWTPEQGSSELSSALKAMTMLWAPAVPSKEWNDLSPMSSDRVLIRRNAQSEQG